MKVTLRASAVAAALAVAVWCAAQEPATEDDKRVDEATDRGLEYLARTQKADGSWADSTGRGNPAVTSLSVMAFMAKGHTPDEGPYGEIINKGIDWVLGQADPNNGLIAGPGGGSGPMYCHGTSTLMLAEAIGMTNGEREKKIRVVLEKAVKLILQAQKVKKSHPNYEGGWRYSISSNDSDISVTGWQVMSLRAAKNAGADVPVEAINDAVAYIKRSACPGGGFGYQPGGGANHSRTGTGILSLEICGQHNTPEAVAGAEWLMKNPPRWPDEFFYYGIYYCSQGMFQVGGKYWEFYRPRLESLLLSMQLDDGSWPSPGSGSEGVGGKAYFTSMSTLALSVKYHYLPIYQR